MEPAWVSRPAWLQPLSDPTTDLAWTATLEDVGWLEAGASELLLVDAHKLSRGGVIGRSPLLIGKSRKPVAVCGVVVAESVAVPENRAVAH